MPSRERSITRRVVVRSALALLAVVGVAPVTTTLAAHPAGAATSSPARFVPVSPDRLLDTRSGARPGAGAVVSVPVTGRAGVGSNATAVVVNVTATAAAGPGYVTVFPSGSAVPTASNLNLAAAGATIANLVTVPVGANGAVSLFTDAGTHLIVDVFGWYEPIVSSGRGRFLALDPVRAYDSRPNNPVAPGGSRRVQLTGVPTAASAAVLNITAVDSRSWGFWTAYAAGSPRPATSNLNTAPGATVPNQVIVPVNGAAIELFSDVGGHFLVDVAGYFTGDSAAVSDAGLFQAVAPTRLLDTRGVDNPLGARVKPYAGWTIELPVAGRAGVPATASAVVTNTTIASARRAGYVTVYPAGIVRPNASNLNVGYVGHTVANHTVVPVTNRGASFFTDGGGHLIVDIAGYYTGGARVAVLGPVTNPEPKVALPGTIVIPAIGLNTVLQEGIDIATVDRGPGHWPETASPGGVGNMTVFGHRVSHTHPFRDIDDLKVGDSIFVVAEGVTYRYEMIRADVVTPDNIAVLSPYDPAQRTMTLIACHPPTSVTYRYVVKARFVEITAS
jgi:LPXTG-site transpeptidase (sortase) family protein